MLSSERLLCCFCGRLPGPAEYIELEIHVAGTSATQAFGAHRKHLADRLHSGFSIELDAQNDL